MDEIKANAATSDVRSTGKTIMDQEQKNSAVLPAKLEANERSYFGRWATLLLRRGALRALLSVIDLYTCRLRGYRPIIVFQMGKVGSTSVIGALNRIGKVRAFQAHRLNPKRTRNIQKRFKSGETYYRDMIFERALHSWLKRQRTPVEIIVSIREPFAHSYSAFFQNIPRNTRGNLTLDSATVGTLKWYFLNWEEFGLATSWIDDEYIPVLEHDPYGYGFDNQDGTRTITSGKFQVLIFKVEIEDSRKEQAISDFLNVDGVGIKNDNAASDKTYAELYNSFQEQVKIPREIADHWLESRYMKCFYTEEEARQAYARYAEN